MNTLSSQKSLEPFTFGNLKDKSKFVMALRERREGDDEESLSELIKRRGIHHAASLTGLKGKLAKIYFDRKFSHLGVDYNDIYLIPFHATHFPADEQQGRVIATKDGKRVWSIKGIGNRLNRAQRRNINDDIIADDKVIGVQIPLGRAKDKLYGALFDGIYEEYDYYAKLKAAYARFKKEEPELAKSLNAPSNAPFAKPVASFSLLESTATRYRKLNGKKGVVKFSLHENESLGIGNPKVLIREVPATNTRIKEFYNNPRLAKSDFIQSLQAHYGLPVKANPTNTERFALYKNIQNRLLIIFHVARSYAGIALHKFSIKQGSNDLLSDKDFNGVALLDLNNVDAANYDRLNKDESLMEVLDSRIRNTLDIPPGEEYITAHPHYNYIINRAREKVS